MKNKLYPNFSDLPYAYTPVSAVKSRNQIIALLEKYGIENHMLGQMEGKEALQFQIDTTVQGVKVKKMVRVDVPVIKAYRSGKLIEVTKDQVMRMVFYTLKSILESTKYGVFKMEHLLMSYILTQLPDGKIVQIKDVLEEHPLLLSQITSIGDNIE